MAPDLQRRRRRLDDARTAFAGGLAALGELPPDMAPEVGESWSRCVRRVPVGRTAPVVLEDAGGRWSDSPIRRAAADVVGELGRLAVSEDFVAAVTDAEGCIIWSAAGRSMGRLADRANFVAGSTWVESAAGTNAPGLALVTGRPTSVFATEHWCESVQDWVCYAAPIRTPAGQVAGVLDLSAPWKRASPLAMATVVAMARLVEQQLVDLPWSPPELRLRLLGQPSLEMAGQPVHITQRQFEILAVLAIRGPVGSEELYDLIYGEREVSQTTLKAEISHLRHALGGAIESRPYRLSVGVEVDVTDALGALHDGDLASALKRYAGRLLPASESPYVTELRNHVDVSMRAAVLRLGGPDQLLQFAQVNPYDTEPLERAASLVGPYDARWPEITSRLAHAMT